MHVQTKQILYSSSTDLRNNFFLNEPESSRVGEIGPIIQIQEQTFTKGVVFPRMPK